jgi:hypothetical protein
MKLMEMGGMEEILLERETTILTILKILPKGKYIRPINPSLKRDTMYKRRLVFIFL